MTKSGHRSDFGPILRNGRDGGLLRRLFADRDGYRIFLIRYAEGRCDPERLHSGDEHIFILGGSQEDETGCYSEGGYVYNPTGTAHRVWSEEGCLDPLAGSRALPSGYCTPLRGPKAFRKAPREAGFSPPGRGHPILFPPP